MIESIGKTRLCRKFQLPIEERNKACSEQQGRYGYLPRSRSFSNELYGGPMLPLLITYLVILPLSSMAY